jgi:hypothetical protein
VHREPGGLVDDGESGVLIEDGEVEGDVGRDVLDGRHFDFDGGAGRDLVGGLAGDRAIDRAVAGGDEPLKAYAAEIREGRGERGVEAAGVFGC